MLNLEQISTLINGLKSWVLNEIKKSKADLGPLADEFVSFKEQVQDTIDNAALKPMVVMAKDGTLEANYNSSEIYNYVTSGGTAVFKFEAAILPLIAFDETFSTFLFTENSGDSIGTMGFIVYEDGRIEVEEEVSNTVYIVNLDEYGTSASRGAAEIIDIANSGRLVLLEYSGDYYNLVEKSNADIEQAIATFQKCFYYETEIRVVSIDIDYNAGANINTYDSVHIGVSSVNGQSGEVELTAEDVGALTEEDLSEMGFLTSEDAVAGSPVPLNADTLGGHDADYFATKEYVDEKYQKTILAPATAEVGQTIRVSEVDDNGKPIAWEAVDLSKEWRYLGKFTVGEDVAIVTITKDDNNEPFNLKSIIIQGFIAPNEAGATGYIGPGLNNKWVYPGIVGGSAKGEGIVGKSFRQVYEIRAGRVFCTQALVSQNNTSLGKSLQNTSGAGSSVEMTHEYGIEDSITKLTMQGNGATIGAGSYFELWGVDA